MPILVNLGLAGLGIIAGAMLGTQAPINTLLARGFGSPIVAATISFGTGTVLLAALSLALARLRGLDEGWRELPVWVFVSGGALGAVYVTSAILLTPRLGAAATMGFVISGQLLAGFAIDSLGLFGLPSLSLTLPRMAGAALLVGGALVLRFA